MGVLVFKTSVQSAEGVTKLTHVLNTLAGCNQWNFALDDCDRILRIVTPINPDAAIQVLMEQGYYCEELQ